jgi:hypothetical protein
VAFADADGVFRGTVADVRVSDASPSGTPYAYFVRFKVRKAWKGVSSAEITLGTGAGGGDCGKHFEPGVEYLVYASPVVRRPAKPDGGSADGEQSPPMLETHICTRTAQVSQAGEDLHFLRSKKLLRLQAPPPRTAPAKPKK